MNFKKILASASVESKENLKKTPSHKKVAKLLKSESVWHVLVDFIDWKLYIGKVDHKPGHVQ